MKEEICWKCEENEATVERLDYWGKVEDVICENCNESTHNAEIEAFYGGSTGGNYFKNQEKRKAR